MIQVRPVEDAKKPGDDLSSVELVLPSKGVDYPQVAQGPFQVRPPRVRQVEFLAGMNAQNYDEQLTRLLRSMIESPVLVDPIDLTMGDRQFLHVWVRAQLDPMYQFDATCPKCKEVNKGYQLKIADIPVKEVPERYSPGMKLTLPRSKQVVAVRLETARDRAARATLEGKGFTEWVVRKAMVVMNVDGRQMTDEERCAWLRNLPGGDDLFMGEYLRWQAHGPDLANCPFTCTKCKKESTLRLPFRLEFYLPTVHAASVFGDAVGGGGDVEGGDLPGDAGDRGDGV